ncbi:MAG: branched-chain amino acid transport system ATP-binding protein [Subtercola sp.]|nr:branched-chain amino acid transport system ATP-binding protein [Subtercola sp.]
MSDTVLEIKDLKVAYEGAGLGVQGLSMRADRGEIVALLGANGAGKTTTLRAISGFLPMDIAKVTAGSISLNGRDLGHMAPHRRVKLGMSIVPEREKVFRFLTVEENLKVCARSGTANKPADTLELIYDLFPKLVDRRGVSAGFLSGGERQMLGIGRALMTDPSLLLADEVSLGIAPNLVVELLDTLRRINRERGITIVVVEQNAGAALRVADRVYVLENGKTILEGTPRELIQREDFFSVYFGLEGDADEHPISAEGTN